MIEEIKARIDEYKKPENRVKRVKEFIQSLPPDSYVEVKVETRGVLKIALLESNDFIEFLKQYD